MLGEYQKAIDGYTKAIALDSEHYWAYVRRCDLYETLGKTELAKKDRQHSKELERRRRSK